MTFLRSSLTVWIGLLALVITIAGCKGNSSPPSYDEYLAKARSAIAASEALQKPANMKDAKVAKEALVRCSDVVDSYQGTAFEKLPSYEWLKTNRANLTLISQQVDAGSTPPMQAWENLSSCLESVKRSFDSPKEQEISGRSKPSPSAS